MNLNKVIKHFYHIDDDELILDSDLNKPFAKRIDAYLLNPVCKGRLPCLCCGYPLDEEDLFNASCWICDWTYFPEINEVDINEARHNFEKYNTIYDLSDIEKIVSSNYPSQTIYRQIGLSFITKQLIKTYELLLTIHNIDEEKENIKKLWQKIDRYFKMYFHIKTPYYIKQNQEKLEKKYSEKKLTLIKKISKKFDALSNDKNLKIQIDELQQLWLEYFKTERIFIRWGVYIG